MKEFCLWCFIAVHHLDTNKLRNVAKFFAHLLFTDAITWEVLQNIRLTEDDTTSSSRIFIKILFQVIIRNHILHGPTSHYICNKYYYAKIITDEFCVLTQELSEYMGLPKLHQRLCDKTMAICFEGVFPRDHPQNSRFSINFFTSIGLGGLT